MDNITLEEARSRLREIAANLDDRAMFVEAQELRDIAARLGINRGGSRPGAGRPLAPPPRPAGAPIARPCR